MLNACVVISVTYILSCCFLVCFHTSLNVDDPDLEHFFLSIFFLFQALAMFVFGREVSTFRIECKIARLTRQGRY